MPHYKDGTLVQVGDIAKGTGYNIKHEIIGPVVHVVPDSESCNIQVAVLKPDNYRPDLGKIAVALANTKGAIDVKALMSSSLDGLAVIAADGKASVLRPSVEYGACKDFELVYRPEA